MLNAVHPEILGPDWLPPVPLARSREVAQAVRLLEHPPEDPRSPPMVLVEGPEGSGTSTVARAAGRTLAARKRSSPGPSEIRLYAVRTRGCRTGLGVASALLRYFDPGFDGRGFSVVEVLAGFLRRLHRDRRVALILLDDIGVGGPDLAVLLRAFSDPERFLPEGESGVPSILLILAGRREGLEGATRGFGLRPPPERWVRVSPYSDAELGAILRDRMERALGRSAPETILERVTARVRRDGCGISRAMDLVRREILGPSAIRPGSVYRPLESRLDLLIERHVVRALARAADRESVPLRDIRRWEALLARAEGARPLPTTTFWRRIIRLEQAGYVRREIRPGGMGGTQSVLHFLSPVREWFTAPPGRDTPRGSGPSGGGPWSSGWAPPDQSPTGERSPVAVPD